ncbi:unnamed protein product, partial [Phaeothamnion confervicola]
ASLDYILGQKKEFLRLFVVAAVLGFGVGVLSNQFASAQIPFWISFGAGSCLVVLSIGSLLVDIFRSLSFLDVVDAVIFLDCQQNKILHVDDYEFAENLADTMHAVKAESKSLQTMWEKNPLVPKRELPDPTENRQKDELVYFAVTRVQVSQENGDISPSKRLLHEAMQFV